MFFDDKLKLSVDILSSRVDDLSKLIKGSEDRERELWRKVHGLYKKDYHDTERPKVDILSDTVADNETEQWNAINKLQKRIEKLEKKK